MGFTMLDRVGRDEIRQCMKTSDAIQIARLMRRMVATE